MILLCLIDGTFVIEVMTHAICMIQDIQAAGLVTRVRKTAPHDNREH